MNLWVAPGLQLLQVEQNRKIITVIGTFPRDFLALSSTRSNEKE